MLKTVISNVLLSFIMLLLVASMLLIPLLQPVTDTTYVVSSQEYHLITQE